LSEAKRSIKLFSRRRRPDICRREWQVGELLHRMPPAVLKELAKCFTTKVIQPPKHAIPIPMHYQVRDKHYAVAALTGSTIPLIFAGQS
jgi:hypothetical protein